MTERLDLAGDIDFSELSRKIEQAWRIVSRPQNYSEFEIEGASDFLEETQLQMLNSLQFDSKGYIFQVGEGLMTGLYHYIGPIFLSKSAFVPGSDNDVSLN